MVSDSEPRYRLVDSNGNVVGTLFAEADGTLKLQEGTSGSDNELAFGTDGALSVASATIGGDIGVGFPSASDSLSVSFDTWLRADQNRPTLLIFDVSVETDGSTRGYVQIQIDESGGTSTDYNLDGPFADPGLGSGGQSFESVLVPLPANAQFQVQNSDDPNNNNSISDVRRFTL